MCLGDSRGFKKKEEDDNKEKKVDGGDSAKDEALQAVLDAIRDTRQNANPKEAVPRALYDLIFGSRNSADTENRNRYRDPIQTNDNTNYQGGGFPEGYRVDDYRTDHYRNGNYRNGNYGSENYRNENYRNDNYRTDNHEIDNYRNDNYRKDNYRTDNYQTDNYQNGYTSHHDMYNQPHLSRGVKSSASSSAKHDFRDDFRPVQQYPRSNSLYDYYPNSPQNYKGNQFQNVGGESSSSRAQFKTPEHSLSTGGRDSGGRESSTTAVKESGGAGTPPSRNYSGRNLGVPQDNISSKAGISRDLSGGANSTWDGVNSRDNFAVDATVSGLTNLTANSETNNNDLAAKFSSKDSVKRDGILSQCRKTHMCQYYMKGVCRNRSACWFAHGPNELKSKPDLSFTSWCKEFLMTGSCARQGRGCRFCHSQEDFRDTLGITDGKSCWYFPRGLCQFGDKCRFSHDVCEPVFCDPVVGDVGTGPEGGGVVGVGPSGARGAGPGGAVGVSTDARKEE